MLTAFLDDRLFLRPSDKAVFIVRSTEGAPTSVALIDPVSLEEAGSAPPDELTKIGTNNRLRRLLKTAVARFALTSPDAAIRLGAVAELMRSLDDAGIALLRQRAGVEKDPGVKAEIETGLALAALDGSDQVVRLEAISTLSRRLRPEVRNRLAAMLEKTPRRRLR